MHPGNAPIPDSPLQRAFVLWPITLWIQCDQPLQKLLAAYIGFCFQPLVDEICMRLKGIHTAATALTRFGPFL